ncbi:MAG: hypothetical protein JRN01_05675 [Nitrososphaerota archaeon]|jgi:hypothetical protein|nr:hypothetical protein [Nitrososphaerota archaeon]
MVKILQVWSERKLIQELDGRNSDWKITVDGYWLKVDAVSSTGTREVVYVSHGVVIEVNSS